jgi:hypothetical protein
LNCILAVLLVFVASGCSWMPWNWGKKNKAAATQNTPVRPANTNDNRLLIAATSVGKIVSVNQQGRFVVLQFPIGQVPANDTRLVVYRADAKVAEVKVTGPQQDNLTVADIVLGTVQEGDEVRAQ